MTNVYTTAFEARILEAKNKNASSSNIKKLEKMRDACSSVAVVEALMSHDVDAERFSRAIYASEKAISMIKQSIELDARNINENTYAIFRTALNCYKHDDVMTKEDARASISRDIIVKDERKHLVFVRQIIQTEQTVNAQHQTSIDALVTLNILSVSKTHKNAYTFNMNELSERLCKNFSLDTEKASVSELEDAE